MVVAVIDEITRPTKPLKRFDIWQLASSDSFDHKRFMALAVKASATMPR